VLVVVSACQALAPKADRPIPVIEGATEVGTERCLTCHAEIGEAHKVRHNLVFAKRSDACEICHGPGSRHVESMSEDDIVGTRPLRALDAESRSALCLTCHGTQLPRFAHSEHAREGVSCWQCHAAVLHAGAPEPAEASASIASGATFEMPGDAALVSAHRRRGEVQRCYQCHGEIAADFLLQFHHPVPEGQMGCTDCHEVHREDVQSAADRGNERCLSCHHEIRGPFVFEHLAMDDGCVICHAPHGSLVEKLLTQNNNGLCEQCHFDARFPLIGAVDHAGLLSGGARCYDCHLQVHGSNTDENFMPLRMRRGVIGVSP
jgi:predicted CXXCH cytochrome family protein